MNLVCFEGYSRWHIPIMGWFWITLPPSPKAIHQQNCEKCHANDGSEAKDDAGVLAGQWTPYLRKTFEEYKADKRHMEQKMKPKIKELDKDGIEALLNYYASFK